MTGNPAWTSRTDNDELFVSGGTHATLGAGSIVGIITKGGCRSWHSLRRRGSWGGWGVDGLGGGGEGGRGVRG